MKKKKSVAELYMESFNSIMISDERKARGDPKIQEMAQLLVNIYHKEKEIMKNKEEGRIKYKWISSLRSKKGKQPLHIQ